MKKMGLVFLNIEKSLDDNGIQKMNKLVGLKVNPDLQILSKFEEDLDVQSEQYKTQLYKVLTKFEGWVINPYENKFVTFEHQDLIFLSECYKMVHIKSKIKDFHKIMGYQYWNIQNEMAFRLGIPKEKLTLEEALSVYGLTFVGDKESAEVQCFNTYTLSIHFRTDEKRNQEVFKKQSRGKNVEANNSFSILELRPIRSKGEDMLRAKMEEGWNISIDCKANSRGFGLLYEAKAFLSDGTDDSEVVFSHFGTGKTLEELMKNLFEKDNSIIAS